MKVFKFNKNKLWNSILYYLKNTYLLLVNTSSKKYDFFMIFTSNKMIMCRYLHIGQWLDIRYYLQSFFKSKMIETVDNLPIYIYIYIHIYLKVDDFLFKWVLKLIWKILLTCENFLLISQLHSCRRFRCFIKILQFLSKQMEIIR